MKSLYNFIIKPLKDRYENIKEIKGKQLIVNTSIENHIFISKKAVVVSTPAAYASKIKVGDNVYVHHNIFRRFHDVRGIERNSRSYFKEDKYFVTEDQIFLYKRFF